MHSINCSSGFLHLRELIQSAQTLIIPSARWWTLPEAVRLIPSPCYSTDWRSLCGVYCVRVTLGCGPSACPRTGAGAAAGRPASRAVPRPWPAGVCSRSAPRTTRVCCSRWSCRCWPAGRAGTASRRSSPTACSAPATNTEAATPARRVNRPCTRHATCRLYTYIQHTNV